MKPIRLIPFLSSACALLCFATLTPAPAQAADPAPAATDVADGRKPADEADLRYWLQNMIWDHLYSPAEASAATGMSEADVKDAMKRLNILPENAPSHAKDAGLRIMPYPGGRHPRIGFLEGAQHPQRETKVSVFTPWDKSSYIVLDIPEAIFVKDDLIFLAHVHIPTVWEKKGITLSPLEWLRENPNDLHIKRTLPNGVSFQTQIKAEKDIVKMTLSITNGTKDALHEIRVQNCVLLKEAKGFEEQSDDNKLSVDGTIACHSKTGDRWIITHWNGAHATWTNPKCPCMHSDPKFPDCAPGETQQITGWVAFYEGTDVRGEIQKLVAAH